MSRKEAIKKLSRSLRKAIEHWVADPTNSTAWDELKIWLGDKLPDLMARVAMTVLESHVDLQEYLEREGLL